VIPGSVSMAYVNNGETVTTSFFRSVLDLTRYDSLHEDRIGRAGGPIYVHCGTGGLIKARNESCEVFLAGQGEWLFLVDTDMGFLPDALERLLATAGTSESRIVAGLTFGMRHLGPDGLGGFVREPWPMIYGFGADVAGVLGFVETPWWPDGDRLITCEATGAAFVIIHRSVVEAVGKEWFTPVRYDNGVELSEDLSFFWRVRQALGPGSVIVDSEVITTHAKTVFVSPTEYVDYLVLKGLRAEAK